MPGQSTVDQAGSNFRRSCVGCAGNRCRHCWKRQRSAAAAPRGKRVLVEPANQIYLYDGSLAGFFCCVHESVYSRTLPHAIEMQHLAQPSLLPQLQIDTNYEKAVAVQDSIPLRIGHDAAALIEHVFYSCMPEKELIMLRFLLFAYEQGPHVMQMLGHPLVAPLLAAQKHLFGERQLLMGFIRFSDNDGVLTSTITPKNFVLPYLANHFVGRLSREDFMIYDKTHKAALIYEGGKTQLIQLESVEFPAASETEANYRALWKQFYKTIAIEARENPRCRMTHMPKRYWENMVEMEDVR